MSQEEFTVNVEPSTSNNTNNNLLNDEKKIQHLKNQVNEVSNIMEENIKKIVERGTRLENIENRSSLMSNRADEFRSNARKVQRKAWLENQKMNIVYFFLFVLACLLIYLTFK